MSTLSFIGYKILLRLTTLVSGNTKVQVLLYETPLKHMLRAIEVAGRNQGSKLLPCGSFLLSKVVTNAKLLR